MISFKQQFVLAAATVLLAACGGGGGGTSTSTETQPILTMDSPEVKASILSEVEKKSFRWVVQPTPSTVTVKRSLYDSDLTVQVYRYTQEAIDNGTMGDLVGSGTVGADGSKVTLDLIADQEESVLVQVLDGPAKREYDGKPYRIAKVKDLGTLSF